MYLPLTTLEEAWGDSDDLKDEIEPYKTNNKYIDETFQEKYLTSHVIPKSSNIDRHQNRIVHTIPSRIDVPLFDRKLIETLMSKSPQDRTMLVTKLLREHYVSSKQTTKPTDNIEYYQYATNNTNDSDSNLVTILFIVLIFIFIDKLVTVWNNS